MIRRAEIKDIAGIIELLHQVNMVGMATMPRYHSIKTWA